MRDAAEALVAQLQITANDTTSQLAAIGEFIAQFEPALAPAPVNSTDAGSGDDQPEPAELEARAPRRWTPPDAMPPGVGPCLAS